MTSHNTAIISDGIHKTAVIADGAKIHESAVIGPYAVIGPNVTIGEGTKIGAHSVIDGHTTIGSNCRIYATTSIGLEPQDLKYKDEPTGVVVGNNVTIREFVSIHRGTGDRHTIVGDDSFLMNYVHLAHDCKIGKGVILTNNTQFAGHVQVDDYVVFSGFCIVHQFVRIGRSCMVGGMTGTRVDLPPYTICDGRPAAVRGVNVIGLRRQKINAETRAAIKQAYKLIYRYGLNTSQALTRIEEEIQPFPEIQEICNFFRNSKRGVAVAFGENDDPGSMEDLPVDEI
jgi:UDP-N-acetylglucosamine acyltransferase